MCAENDIKILYANCFGVSIGQLIDGRDCSAEAMLHVSEFLQPLATSRSLSIATNQSLLCRKLSTRPGQELRLPVQDGAETSGNVQRAEREDVFRRRLEEDRSRETAGSHCNPLSCPCCSSSSRSTAFLSKHATLGGARQRRLRMQRALRKLFPPARGHFCKTRSQKIGRRDWQNAFFSWPSDVCSRFSYSLSDGCKDFLLRSRTDGRAEDLLRTRRSRLRQQNRFTAEPAVVGSLHDSCGRQFPRIGRQQRTSAVAMGGRLLDGAGVGGGATSPRESHTMSLSVVCRASCTLSATRDCHRAAMSTDTLRLLPDEEEEEEQTVGCTSGAATAVEESYTPFAPSRNDRECSMGTEEEVPSKRGGMGRTGTVLPDEASAMVYRNRLGYQPYDPSAAVWRNIPESIRSIAEKLAAMEKARASAGGNGDSAHAVAAGSGDGVGDVDDDDEDSEFDSDDGGMSHGGRARGKRRRGGSKTKLEEEKALRQQAIDEIEPERRRQFFAARQIAGRTLGTVGYLCDDCWLPMDVCICGQLQSSQLWEGIHFWVYMHAKDFRRKNNTGKLLWQVFGPRAATLCLCGIPEHEDRMWREFAEAGCGSVYALFPLRGDGRSTYTVQQITGDCRRQSYGQCEELSGGPEEMEDSRTSDATTAATGTREEEEGKEERRSVIGVSPTADCGRGDQSAQSAKGRDSNVLHFVLLDGTWNNSKAMLRRLLTRSATEWPGEEMKCISLSPTVPSVMHGLRPQPSLERSCTAAAAANLLRELDASDTLSSFQLSHSADAIDQAVKVLLDALSERRERHGKPALRLGLNRQMGFQS
ncbi:hypothetical protein CBR_g35040 [Chara braunii]|uniref:tRNA-uridine aminocarboxypropyltransferase n=1 Tax=Chara braunii TaxID=69332 RepID=A0A388LKB6_CHABU|nr:hypothetical protein CBR_g35040 [Chara braunii]|eukprot:GBG82675.1 hypothetical protein CBR_g35040 [Chara braunii]